MSVVHTVTVKRRRELLATHGASVVRPAIKAATKRSAMKHKAEAAEASPVDTGLLRRAWRVFPDEGKGIVLENEAPHSGVIELGRRPGKWPPGEYNHGAGMCWSGPLFEWADRKIRVGVERDFGRGKRGKGMRKVKAARLAYLVARKLAKKGMAPRHIVRSRLDRWAEEVAAEVDREIERRVSGEK